MSIQANSLTRVTTVDGNADVILVDPTTNDGTIINAKALANSGTPDGYNDLKSAVRTNTSDITVLKSRADSAASDMSALQSAVAANTTDVVGLKSTVAGHTDDIADLRDEVDEQTMYIRSLASSVPTPVDTAAEMTNYSQIYIYMGNETGYTRGNWYYWDGSSWVSGGTYGGAVTDPTLSVAGSPADAKAVGDAMAGIGAASVPTEVRQAMLTLFQKAAYIETGLADEVAVITAWAEATTSITVSPSTASVSNASPTAQLSAVTTPAGGAVTWASSNTAVATVSSTGLVTAVGNGTATITATSGTVSASCAVTVTGFATLTGITAVYTQSGTVYDTASLDDLKTDLVVTASYDNGTTATITNYTLSGTLAEGTSTITVSYDGFTDTFSVTVSSYSTSPSIAQYDVSWTTSGVTTGKVGGCITDYYEITIDPDALKATSHYDATNDYMTTAGDIWKLKLLRPNSQSISFGSGGKMIAEVTRDGVRKFNYFSPAWSSDTEANVGDSRQMTNVLNADNSKIKISFTLATADIDDSYAYWDTTTSGVMPIGITAGDIIFAGRNTPYYGLHNINEASS